MSVNLNAFMLIICMPQPMLSIFSRKPTAKVQRMGRDWTRVKRESMKTPVLSRIDIRGKKFVGIDTRGKEFVEIDTRGKEWAS